MTNDVDDSNATKPSAEKQNLHGAPRVTGIGGVFFRANNPAESSAWYQQHLGIAPDWEHGKAFAWRHADNPQKPGMTVWSQFASDTAYFGNLDQQYMINYRVDNLDTLLDALRQEGVWIDDKREDSDYGRFAWIKDCDGNRIELWQPPEGG